MTDAGGILNRDAQIGLRAYWKATVFETDANDRVIYMGRHEMLNEPTSSDGWAIWKISYDASGIVSQIEVQTGIYDNRATTMVWR